jgi:hypothetical protein
MDYNIGKQISLILSNKLRKMKQQIFVKLLIINILSFYTISLSGQVGGVGTYKFLTLTNSARTAALGTKNISLNDGDLNLAIQNPALLTPVMDKNIALNYINYFAGIGFGYSAYAFNVDSVGTFSVGAQYVDYGSFKGADIAGTRTGTFYAKDFAANLSYSRAIDSSFRLGVTLKPVFSSYERYSSYGLVADFGATYTADEGRLCVAAVVYNVGSQFKAYTNGNYEKMPLEILVGVSKRLTHAPFRISITAHNLQQYDMLYDKNEDLSSSTPSTEKQSKLEKFGDNFFRHIIGAVEFLPTKSFYISGAYNFQRKKEMALENAPGMVGFSFGAGLRLKRFSLSYGRAVYHAAGGSNHFSLLLNLSQGFRK